MSNKINLKDLCILIMVLERFGGNSFLGTYNMYTSYSSWAVCLRGKGTTYLALSAVFFGDVYSPMFFLSKPPSLPVSFQASDTQEKRCPSPADCSSLVFMPPGISFIISGLSDGKLASASQRS